MPLFKFKAASANGRVQEVLQEGDTPAAARRRLQARGLIPIDFLGQSDSVSSGSSLGWGFRRRFDVVGFTDRLVPLLRAEIPLERALSIVEDTAETPQEREITTSFRRGLHEGRRFSQLIRDRGHLFPSMYSSIVEAGEESGALPKVLGQLHTYLLMIREMRGFIISAAIYPAFILCVCGAVVAILLGLVVPRFATIVGSISGKPSLSTVLLIQLSDGFRQFWWVIPIGVIFILVLIRQTMREGSKSREKWDEMVLRLPLLGRMVLLANIARLIRTMAILMKSGVHILDTVTIAARVLSNHTLRRSIAGLAAELRRGERLSTALSRSRFIPPLVIRMLAVGEETGAPDEMLEQVAERYDEELKQSVKRALAWFEPLIIIVLGGIVGTIVFLLFMTVMDLESGL